jgi:hypothetical protein
VATGGVSAVAVVGSLRGRLGRRVAAGGERVAYGAIVGVAAMAMVASTSGRHNTRLRDPGGRPLGLVSLMLKVGVGEPKALGGSGFGGRMVAEMMLLYVCGRRCHSPPPLLRGGVRGARVDGLFDSTGHLVALPREVGDVLRTEVMVSGACVLAYGGGVFVGEGQCGLVVVLPQPDVHVGS